MTMAPDDNAVRALAIRVRSWFLSRLSSTHRVSLAALLLIGAHLAYRTWVTSGSWFMWDDYIFQADVARGEDDWGWLFHSHFNLVMPLSLVLVKVAGANNGFEWVPVATQMLFMQAAAAFACWWMLRTVFGNKMRILIPLSLYLFLPLTIPPAVWWSVAINQYPHHIAIFGAVGAHALYNRGHQKRFALLAAAFLFLGLASYVKAPLIPLVLVGFSAVYFCHGRSRDKIRQLGSLWPAWLLYSVLTAGYVVIWRSQQTVYAPRQSCELLGVLNRSIVETIGSTLIGGPWRWQLWTGGIDRVVAASNCVPSAYRGDPNLLVGGAPQSLLDPPLVGIVAAWLVAAAVLFYLWARVNHSTRGLSILVPYVLLSAYFVYAGRAGVWGSQISAVEVRYFSDVGAVLALVVGTMLLPVKGSPFPRTARASPLFLVSAPRAVLPILCLVIVASSLASTTLYVNPWHARHDAKRFPERAFIETVIESLRAQTSGTVTVADVPLPPRIALPTLYPHNLPSRKLAPLAPRLEAVESGTDLKILDSNGRIREAHIAERPRSESGPVKACGYLSTDEPVDIPIVPVVNLPWWVSVDYVANTDGRVRVEAGETTRIINVESGLHTVFVQTTGFIDTVTLKSLGELSVCADNVRVGQLHAKGDTQKP